MITKYVVFGQTHKHPDTGQKLKNHMIKVQAANETLINVYVAKKFGPYYSRIISTPDYTHFPGGILETHIIDVHVFEGETSHELTSVNIAAEKINQPKPNTEEDDKRRSRTKTRGVPGEESQTGSNKPEAKGKTKPKQQSDQSIDYLSGGATDNGGKGDESRG